MKKHEFFTMLAICFALALLGYFAGLRQNMIEQKAIQQKVIEAYFLGQKRTLKTVRGIYDFKQNHETALSFLLDLQTQKDTAFLNK